MAIKKEDNGERGVGSTGESTAAPQAGGASAAAAKQTDLQGVVDQVKETGRDIAARSLGAIEDRTQSATSGYKSDISTGLHTLADGLRQTSSTFQNAAEDKPLSSAGARYIEDLANKIENVSNYFESKDPADVVKDVKNFARKNPAIFVGGAFALGFALSRLVRSASNTSAPQSRARA
jgi:hypothetical protein